MSIIKINHFETFSNISNFLNIEYIFNIYEYNIPFNKHFKKILRNGFLQNDGNGNIH